LPPSPSKSSTLLAPGPGPPTCSSVSHHAPASSNLLLPRLLLVASLCLSPSLLLPCSVSLSLPFPLPYRHSFTASLLPPLPQLFSSFCLSKKSGRHGQPSLEHGRLNGRGLGPPVRSVHGSLACRHANPRESRGENRRGPWGKPMRKPR
jgi:hypothetical protein